MDWVDFFFGWLTKGQYEISILDGFMFVIELTLLMLIIAGIINVLDKFK